MRNLERTKHDDWVDIIFTHVASFSLARRFSQVIPLVLKSTFVLPVQTASAPNFKPQGRYRSYSYTYEQPKKIFLATGYLNHVLL